MSSIVQIQTRPQPRSFLIWFAPVQAAIVFSVIAVTSGGQMLRTWLLAALVWLMALPLLVGLVVYLLMSVITDSQMMGLGFGVAAAVSYFLSRSFGLLSK